MTKPARQANLKQQNTTMKRTIHLAATALCLGTAATLADDIQAVELEKPDSDFIRIRVGATYRDGMKSKVKGGVSHTASLAASSSKASGSVGSAKDSESASLTFGYTGGDRTFGTGTTALGSGTVHADGTYEGGDYSAVYDDVLFSDMSSSTTVVGGRTETKSETKPVGSLSWKGEDPDGGTGFSAEAECPVFGIADWAEAAVFAGYRGWWGVDASAAGSGASVVHTSSTRTWGAVEVTSQRTYDLTAPLDLDGKLDYENAEVFETEVVKTKPLPGSSSSSRSSARSFAKIDADVDLQEAVLGAALSCRCGRFSLAVRPMAVFAFVDVDARRTETLVSSSGKTMRTWSDKGDESKFAFGGGVDLLAEVSLTDHLSIWASGGYEWIEEVELDVGPQKLSVDPSAWTVSAGVAVSF